MSPNHVFFTTSDSGSIAYAPDGSGESRSTYTFTLTPNDLLIDSSSGQPLTYQRTLAQINTPYGGVSLDQTGYLEDIPIGDYTISGKVMEPDGSTQMVLFDGNNSSEEITWAGKSEPSIHSVDPLPVNISVRG